MAELKVFCGRYSGTVYDMTGASYQGCKVLMAANNPLAVTERTNKLTRHCFVTEDKGDVTLAMNHMEKLILMRDDGSNAIIDITTNINENHLRG